MIGQMSYSTNGLIFAAQQKIKSVSVTYNTLASVSQLSAAGLQFGVFLTFQDVCNSNKMIGTMTRTNIVVDFDTTNIVDTDYHDRTTLFCVDVPDNALVKNQNGYYCVSVIATVAINHPSGYAYMKYCTMIGSASI